MSQPAEQVPSHINVFSKVPSGVKWLIYLLGFLTVGNGFTYVMISAYLPEIGVSGGTVGIVLGVSGAVFVASAIPLGIISDRRGRKWMLIGGTLGLPPSLVIFAFTTDFPYLVLAGVIMGVSQGLFLSSWNAMIADQTSPENRDAAFSLSFILFTAASGVGSAVPLIFPPLAGWAHIDNVTIHRYALLFFAALALVTPISLGFLLRRYEEVVRPSKRLIKGKNTRRLLKFSGINGLIGLGAGFIIPLIPLWLFLKFNIMDSVSGPLLALSSATIALAAFASPGLSHKYGPVRAIVLTQSLSMVFMVSVAFVPGAALAAGLYIIRAALMNMSSPISDSYLMGLISPEERGLASAINSIVWRLPNSITTIVGGILLENGYLALPFLIAAGFYAISIVLLYVTFKDVKTGDA